MTRAYVESGRSLPSVWKSNPSAVLSVVFGAVGCLPFIPGLFAVVFGILGTSRARRADGNGRGLAVSGLVLGIVSLVLWTMFGGGIAALLVSTAPIRDAGTQFLHDLAAGDSASVHGGPGLSMVDRLRISDEIKSSGEIRDVKVTRASVQFVNQARTATLTGTIISSASQRGFKLNLGKHENQWKVDRVEWTTPSSPAH